MCIRDSNSPEDVEQENIYNFELSQQYDWFYTWTVIEPRSERTFAQARKILNYKKCAGIKIDPPAHEYQITDADYADRIFSIADEYGAAVLMHPDNPVSYTHLDVYKRQSQR